MKLMGQAQIVEVSDVTNFGLESTKVKRVIVIEEGSWGHSIANAPLMNKFSVSEIKNATEKTEVGVYEKLVQTTHEANAGVGLNAVTHLAIHETRVLGYWGWPSGTIQQPPPLEPPDPSLAMEAEITPTPHRPPPKPPNTDPQMTISETPPVAATTRKIEAPQSCFGSITKEKEKQVELKLGGITSCDELKWKWVKIFPKIFGQEWKYERGLELRKFVTLRGLCHKVGNTIANYRFECIMGACRNIFLIEDTTWEQARASCVSPFLQRLNDVVRAKSRKKSLEEALIEMAKSPCSQSTTIIATQLGENSMFKLDAGGMADVVVANRDNI